MVSTIVVVHLGWGIFEILVKVFNSAPAKSKAFGEAIRSETPSKILVIAVFRGLQGDTTPGDCVANDGSDLHSPGPGDHRPQPGD